MSVIEVAGICVAVEVAAAVAIAVVAELLAVRHPQHGSVIGAAVLMAALVVSTGIAAPSPHHHTITKAGVRQ